MEAPNLQGVVPKVGAVFYLLCNLLIDFFLIGVIYDNIISVLFTGTNHLIYSVLLIVFIVVKTGVVSILIALGGHKKVRIKLNAIMYLMINMIIDWALIEVLYTHLISTLFDGTDQLTYGVLVFIMIVLKTGVVSIMMLLMDEDD